MSDETAPPASALPITTAPTTETPASSAPGPREKPNVPPKPKHILTNNLFAQRTAVKATAEQQQPAKSTLATKSFEEAVSNCKKKVEKIARECRSANRRYRDIHFDLTLDGRFTLDGLTAQQDSALVPRGIARVPDLFENPVFFKDGAKAGDIEQGSDGDCWFLAAISTVTNVEGLLEKICVARDELVGVYGFVFMRDGEWRSTIIDDQLYLSRPEYHDADIKTRLYFSGRENEYNTTFVRGSAALEFARCADPNETWLPLLEKAYAKAHGDYGAIEGGWAGEAVEDLTGGVTSEVFTYDILDKDKFWKEELMQANKEFLFAAGVWNPFKGSEERSRIMKGHSYSVLKAVEAKGERLLLVRNPWGCAEWNGPWADGAKEWTPEWMSLLNHRFGDDGQFYMRYQDFLKKFTIIDRTRLFDPSWTVTSRWIHVDSPFSGSYARVRFGITVPEKSSIVIVLSQLDDRYFRGFEGRYEFNLHFRVHKEGESDYITRSRANVGMRRSVNAELELEPGRYVIIFKVDGEFMSSRMKEADIRKEYRMKDRRKYLQMAMSADMAHAQAGLPPRAMAPPPPPPPKPGSRPASAVIVRRGEDSDDHHSNACSGSEHGSGTESDSAPEDPARTADEPSKISSGERGSSHGKWNRRARRHFIDLPDDFRPRHRRSNSVYVRPEPPLPLPPYNPLPLPLPPPPKPEEEEVWDAVACVGLRVYSQANKGITIDIMVPQAECPDLVDLDDSERDVTNPGLEKDEKEGGKKDEDEDQKEGEKKEDGDQKEDQKKEDQKEEDQKKEDQKEDEKEEGEKKEDKKKDKNGGDEKKSEKKDGAKKKDEKRSEKKGGVKKKKDQSKEKSGKPEEEDKSKGQPKNDEKDEVNLNTPDTTPEYSDSRKDAATQSDVKTEKETGGILVDKGVQTV